MYSRKIRLNSTISFCNYAHVRSRRNGRILNGYVKARAHLHPRFISPHPHPQAFYCAPSPYVRCSCSRRTVSRRPYVVARFETPCADLVARRGHRNNGECLARGVREGAAQRIFASKKAELSLSFLFGEPPRSSPEGGRAQYLAALRKTALSAAFCLPFCALLTLLFLGDNDCRDDYDYNNNSDYCDFHLRSLLFSVCARRAGLRCFKLWVYYTARLFAFRLRSVCKALRSRPS